MFSSSLSKLTMNCDCVRIFSLYRGIIKNIIAYIMIYVSIIAILHKISVNAISINMQLEY